MTYPYIKLTSKYRVANYAKPYIISELASNHNGDMKLAEKMIRASKKAGANAVKFQSWSKDTIFSKKVYQDNFNSVCVKKSINWR